MSKRSAGQGGVCGTGSLLLKPFGEIAVRQDSPRPSGTPLINAGGKGCGPLGLAMTVVDGGWFVCADTAFRSAENLAMMGKFSEMYRTSAIIEDPLG